MFDLVITMGDPAGVGPEVTIRALAEKNDLELAAVLVVGEAAWLAGTAALIGGAAASLAFVEISPVEAAGNRPGNVDARRVKVFNPLDKTLPKRERGRDWPEFGDASFRYVLAGVELVNNGCGRALATAPISKHAWHLAGHDHPGHTELIRDLAGSADVGMMFWGERLKVLLLTTHLPLAEVPGRINQDLVCGKLHLLADFLQRVGLAGDIGLAALNPHAGEKGAFGDEEIKAMEPAVRDLRAAGLPVVGPLPADTLFHQALQGRFVAVVAAYHDQGLAPFKMLHFHDGVNLSIGLPFIRTSADHGTAFDISDKFIADSRSMENAIDLALNLSRKYSDILF